MAAVDHIKEHIERSFTSDPNRTVEDRTTAADFLSTELFRAYPAMGWQDCQAMARQATTYNRGGFGQP